MADLKRYDLFCDTDCLDHSCSLDECESKEGYYCKHSDVLIYTNERVFEELAKFKILYNKIKKVEQYANARVLEELEKHCYCDFGTKCLGCREGKCHCSICVRVRELKEVQQ
jgi:hypothetical protein